MKKSYQVVIWTLVASALSVGLQEPAHAAKATFEAGVSPSTLSLSVDSQGTITGSSTARVDVHRKKVGSSLACNKIQTVEVLKVLEPLPLDESQVLTRFAGFADRKGLCYFDLDLNVQPFSEDEIRGACQGRSGGTQSLAKDGLVTAWNKPPSYIDYTRRFRSTGGTGGVDPKNRKRIRFAANVQCGGNAPPGPAEQVDTRIRRPPSIAAFNMDGWWTLSTGIADRDGEWRFAKTALNQNLGKYSSKGPASKRNGKLIYGNGSGNATLDLKRLFSWSLNDRTVCTGQINTAHSIVMGTCKGSGYRAPKFPFKLTKSRGPVDLGKPQSSVGQPSNSGGTMNPRPAPTTPGKTFTPQPPLPPKPRW